MSLFVKLWGVRGSLPTPQSPEVLDQRIKEILMGFFEAGYKKKTDIKKFLKTLPVEKKGGFGGNTPCVEVFTNSQTVIVDGGSGIRRLGYKLMRGPCGEGKGEVHLLFTHFHWDHLIGLPFFTPIFIPGNKVHMYAVQPELEQIVRQKFAKPTFPVPFDMLGAQVVFHKLEPRKSHKIGDIGFTPYQLDHPDPCWGYKFSHGDRSFSHCVDTEATRMSREALGPDLPLYQGIDFMIFDAQYTLDEVLEKVNWGHAAATIGLDIATREKIKRVLFIHHDPAASDEKIADAERQTREYYQNLRRNAKITGQSFYAVKWSFAREEMEIKI